MFHKLVISRQLSAVRVQRGFALVSAIFILVILAALGGYVVTVSTTQSASQGLDIQGSRAYQAARAGIEWGTYQVLRNAAYTCTTLGVSNHTPVLGASLAGFVVTLACTSQNFPEGANNVIVYQLVSNATFGAVNSPDYADRRLDSTISVCTDPAGARC